MKKKIVLCLLTILILSVLVAAFVSCDWIKSITDKKDEKPNIYQISYFDGVSNKTLAVEENNHYSLMSIPYKCGFSFDGLFDSMEGGTQYVNSLGNSLSPFTDGCDIFLYARFSPKKYTVRLESDGGFVDGGNSMTMYYGGDFSLLPVSATKAHYVFEGWYTRPNGKGTKVTQTTVFSKILFDVDARDEFSLYANYTPEEYTLIFSFGDGSEEKRNLHYGDTVYANAFPKEDDGFREIIGWENNFQPVSHVFMDGNIILRAIWKNYVIVNLNSYDVNKSSVKIYQGDDAKPLNSPSRIGYDFLGWYESPTEKTGLHTELKYDYNIKPKSELFAHWELIKYEASLIANGGIGDYSEKIEYTINTELKLPTLEKENYEFLGWCKYQNLSDAPSEYLSKGTYGVEKFYAKFKGIDIGIRLNCEGGTLASTLHSVEYNAKFTLPVPSKSRYRFLGWFDSADNAVTDERGRSFGVWDSTNQGEQLYAKWEIAFYSLTLNFSGGQSGGYCPSTLAPNSAVTIPTPKKTGYVFCGWYSEDNTFYYDMLSNVQSDTTLTAKWVSAVIRHEDSFWFETRKTGNQNLDVASHSVGAEIPAELKQAIALGRIGVKVSSQINCSVKSMGDATATVSVIVNINGKTYDGPKVSAKGGGYSWGQPQGGKWGETSKIVNDSFILKNADKVTYGVTYKMNSNKTNSKVQINMNFLCAYLTIELYNV